MSEHYTWMLNNTSWYYSIPSIEINENLQCMETKIRKKKKNNIKVRVGEYVFVMDYKKQ